jgi:hypothetical protein
LGDVPPKRLSIKRSGCSIWGADEGPEATMGPPLLVEGVASRHVLSANALRKWLMASGPLCLVEELWRAPL